MSDEKLLELPVMDIQSNWNELFRSRYGPSYMYLCTFSPEEAQRMAKGEMLCFINYIRGV
jgi:hypothetical protein